MAAERAVVFFYQQLWPSGFHCELNRKEVKKMKRRLWGLLLLVLGLLVLLQVTGVYNFGLSFGLSGSAAGLHKTKLFKV